MTEKHVRGQSKPEFTLGAVVQVVWSGGRRR